MGFLIDILIGAASRIVTGELSAHIEPMARWIIGKAVERLPAYDRDRYREEWLAHLEEVPGAVRKLGHAFGCYLGAAKVSDVLAEQRSTAFNFEDALARHHNDPEITVLLDEFASVIGNHGGAGALVKSERAKFDQFVRGLRPVTRKLYRKVLFKVRSENRGLTHDGQ